MAGVRSQRVPRLLERPFTTTNSSSPSSASTAAVEEANQIVVREPVRTRPVVGEGFGTIDAGLDPTETQRDEGDVEGRDPDFGRAARP